MQWWLILTIILASLILLLLIGVPVAFAFFSVFRSISVFSLLPVPLFILMGEIMFLFNIAPKMMDVLDRWIGRIPGRLSLLAVLAGVLFATVSGSSLAGCAMLGSTLRPEMEKRGYARDYALGSIMSSGTLAAMIPPAP